MASLTQASYLVSIAVEFWTKIVEMINKLKNMKVAIEKIIDKKCLPADPQEVAVLNSVKKG